MKFNERLRSLRTEANLTLKEVSLSTGIPVSTYSNYEQGIREPSLETLAIICKSFNASADYLLGLSDY